MTDRFPCPAPSFMVNRENLTIINDAKWAFYIRGENEEMRAVFRQGTSVQQSKSGSNHYWLPSRQARSRRNGAIALDMILNRLQPKNGGNHVMIAVATALRTIRRATAGDAHCLENGDHCGTAAKAQAVHLGDLVQSDLCLLPGCALHASRTTHPPPPCDANRRARPEI